MKVIGIDIDKTKAIFYALEKDADGNIIKLTGNFKYAILSNDTDNSRVREFQTTIHSFFDNINPNKIAILTRQTKGRFKSSPLSFKIEGLIQCYVKIEIEFIPPMTLIAFYKKNNFELTLEHSYQEKAAKLAYYLL
ncbi:MAG: DUF3010 family protein [Saprospiraceae bacterium]